MRLMRFPLAEFVLLRGLFAVFAAFGLVSDGMRVREARTLRPQEDAEKTQRQRQARGVRNEVKRWSHEYSEDVLLPKSATPQPNSGDFPYLPAYTQLRERHYVIFSSGGSVVAVDPARVGSNPANPDEGIYWKLPEAKQLVLEESRPEPPVGRSRPFLCVTVDGDHAFATLYSQRPVRASVAEPVLRTQRIVCIHIEGKSVLWDTDEEGWWDAARKMNLGILERGFSFCGPPVVAGDRVYVGVDAFRKDAEESRVLCLDRRTGLPVWDRLVASVAASHNLFGDGLITYLTMIAEKDGALYAHSNLGVMAAIDAITGAVRWTSKYPRGERVAQFAIPVRYASPLVFHQGKVYALPQDQEELQIFDMATGDAVKLTVPAPDHRPFKWQDIVRMIGECRDMLVLGGSNASGTESIVMRLTDSPQKDDRGNPKYPAGTWHRLVESNVQHSGLGTVHKGLAYLPASPVDSRQGHGGLAIFDGVTWRWVNDPRTNGWSDPDECGNLLVASRYLVVAAATKLTIYTDFETAATHRDSNGIPLPRGAVGRLSSGRKGERILCTAFSPNGKYALLGVSGKNLVLWDVETQKVVRNFEGHLSQVTSVAFSPNGRFALSGSWATSLSLWEVETAKRLRTFRGHAVTSLAFSPDGKYALSGGLDKTLALWEMETGESLRTFVGHTDRVSSVAFSPNGKYALSGDEDGTIGMWKVNTGKPLRKVKGHADRVASVAFSPDGKYALSGSDDKTLALWQMETGERICKFEGHTWRVTCIDISPDGKWALSGGEDGALMLWNIETGRRLYTFKGHRGGVTSIAFSTSGRKIISGSTDSTALIWHPGISCLDSVRLWIRKWQDAHDPIRRELLRETIANLKSDDLDRWEETRERLLALEGDAVVPLLEAYPPETMQALSKETETKLSELMKRLDEQDLAARDEAQSELKAYGWPILEWIRDRLKEGDDLSLEVRSRLNAICQHLELVPFTMGDLGRVRTVLVLMDLLHLPAAREALKRYAEGPPWDYSSELARRAMK